MRIQLLLVCGALLFPGLVACSAEPETSDRSTDGTGGPGGKDDSGWLGSDTYELGGVLRGTLFQEPVGQWRELDRSEELQITLIDEQIRFAKNAAEDVGYRLNLLTDDVVSIEASEDARGYVQLDYAVKVDLIARIPSGGVPGSVGELRTKSFTANVPAEPIGVIERVGDACATGDGSHDVSALNYAYYFTPDKAGCDLDLSTTKVDITEIFDRPTVYPEYDRLANTLDNGNRGFFAAIVPARGDNDPKSRFDAHRLMLENQLKLKGEPLTNGAGTRYEWTRGEVTIVIDLFDPTAAAYTSAFRAALGKYQLILYNGHSNYGTMSLLNEPESFVPDLYQIVMMHSCQSYAYYTRQVFRGKETTDDPKGWDNADVVASGDSSYPTGSPKTLKVLLDNLMAGVTATVDGTPNAAPSWVDIVETMNTVEPGIQYGVAGVRENAWQP